MKLLAIDPGSELSAYALVDTDTRRPLVIDKLPNVALLHDLRLGVRKLTAERVVIEMVTSYGLPVGRDVFETCVWIGRFAEAIHHGWWPRRDAELVPRAAVKLHHCGVTTAKDQNVIAALRDRFAPGVRNYGKGSKDEPGWFYGFKKDVWQAYALGVVVADRIETEVLT